MRTPRGCLVRTSGRANALSRGLASPFVSLESLALTACVLYLKTSTGVKIVCDGGRFLV